MLANFAIQILGIMVGLVLAAVSIFGVQVAQRAYVMKKEAKRYGSRKCK